MRSGTAERWGDEYQLVLRLQAEYRYKRLPYETGSRTVSHLEGLAPSFTLGAGTKNLCVELSTESHILKTTEGFQSKAPHVFHQATARKRASER